MEPQRLETLLCVDKICKMKHKDATNGSVMLSAARAVCEMQENTVNNTKLSVSSAAALHLLRYQQYEAGPYLRELYLIVRKAFLTNQTVACKIMQSLNRYNEPYLWLN